MNNRKIITLPEGYNGQTIKCFAEPILEVIGNTVKLQVAEIGMEYMFKWTYIDVYEKFMTV